MDAVTRLWRVRRTVFEMLVDRGYVVASKLLHETREEFMYLWNDILAKGGTRHDLIILVVKKNDPSDQLIVFFPDEDGKRVGVRPIRMLADKMEERNLSKAIIVTRQPLTPFARTAVQEASPKFEIEVFNESELVVNITRHELVPRHVPLTVAEKKELLDRYHVKEGQLPRILSSDPVARYFGMKRGQVVKTIRPSETAGRYVTYRLCV